MNRNFSGGLLQQAPSVQTAQRLAYAVFRAYGAAKFESSLLHGWVLRGFQCAGQCIGGQDSAIQSRRRNAFPVKAPRPKWLIPVKWHDD